MKVVIGFVFLFILEIVFFCMIRKRTNNEYIWR